MTQVCLALVPGIAVHVWLLGPAILIQLAVASLAALLSEALIRCASCGANPSHCFFPMVRRWLRPGSSP